LFTLWYDKDTFITVLNRTPRRWDVQESGGRSSKTKTAYPLGKECLATTGWVQDLVSTQQLPTIETRFLYRPSRRVVTVLTEELSSPHSGIHLDRRRKPPRRLCSPWQVTNTFYDMAKAFGWVWLLPDDVTASSASSFFFHSEDSKHSQFFPSLWDSHRRGLQSGSTNLCWYQDTFIDLCMSVLRLQTVEIRLVGWGCFLRTFWESDEQQNAALLPFQCVPLSNFKNKKKSMKFNKYLFYPLS